jgi:hypothetical protein
MITLRVAITTMSLPLAGTYWALCVHKAHK